MLKIVGVSATTLFCAGLVLGQGGYPGRGGPHGDMGPGPLGMFSHQVVTGAPYSADVSHQSTQTLNDGNTIAHSTNGHVARDSQGRTYSQETIDASPFGRGPMTVTFISDPVAGYTYMLNSSKKQAYRRAFHAETAGSSSKPPRPAGSSDGTGPTSPDVVKADLGTQTINGVAATGKSTTRTVPAGTIGNSLPLVSTSETWLSTDLKVVVLAKRSDPRMGQSTFQLTNIQRTEPAASVFQVPSDYTITDAKAGGPRGPGNGGPPEPPQQ